jgi:hypothetical protein
MQLSAPDIFVIPSTVLPNSKACGPGNHEILCYLLFNSFGYGDGPRRFLVTIDNVLRIHRNGVTMAFAPEHACRIEELHNLTNPGAGHRFEENWSPRLA